MSAASITNIPFEVLSRIFVLMNDTPLSSGAYRSSALCAIDDLNSVLQVCSQFREVAVDSPQLWTSLPYLNDADDTLVDTMLQQSSPLPFSLAFLEDDTLPIADPVWDSVLNHAGRIGQLRIEVASPLGGTITKFFLTLPSPVLQRCMVTFQGPRNVCLELDGTIYPFPFANHAPMLETLDLANCYISPHLLRLPSISSLSIHYFGPASRQGSAVSMKKFALSSGQFTHLRHLVIWNCFSQTHFWEDVPEGPIAFPFLQQLTVSIPLDGCERLAKLVVYPPSCTISVCVILPRTAGTHDAKTAAKASALFVPSGELFDTCRVVLLEQDAPSIRLVRPGDRGYVSLRFLLTEVDFTITPASNLLLYVLNILSLPLSLPHSPIQPYEAFRFELWDALAHFLQRQLIAVTKFHAIFEREEDFVWSIPPTYPLALFPKMPNVVITLIEPPAVYTNRPFFHGAVKAFPELRRIVVKLTDSLIGQSLNPAKIAVSDFLDFREWEGRAVGEALFVVYKEFVRQGGFSGDAAGFREAVNDYAADFPSSTALMLVVK